MVRYIAKRLVFMVIALFVVATATFFLIQLLPGSPFNDAKLSEAARAQLDAKYGLDDPLAAQYARYMGNVVQGDLGDSFYFDGRPVTDVISDRLPVSAFLGAQALIVGLAVGMPLGIIAAMRHNGFMDYAAVFVSIIGYSVPSFVLGPVMQYWIAVKWELLPIAFFESWTHSILPSLALAAIVVATVARFVRAEMLEVLGQDYVTLATAKGLSKVAVVYKHVIRNSLIPLVTVIAPLAVALLTGSLVIEQIFAVPGLGEQFVTSIRVNDYFMITGLAMFFSVFFIVAVLVQDILYGVIDPRIRVSGSEE